MQSLATEEYTPKDQEGLEPKVSFKIKPLNSLQLTEIMQDGVSYSNGTMKLTFKGVLLCLNYGLGDPSLIPGMMSRHHSEVATKIWKKSMLIEDERKN